MIIKFDEAALHKAFGPTFVEGIRHIVRQLGALTEQTTLPEVATLADALVPRVDELTVTLTATNVALDDLGGDLIDHRHSNADLVRRLDEMQAELERGRSDRAALGSRISDMQDQFGINEQPLIAETGATIRLKLGVSTLSGSNTGDQSSITGNAGTATVLQTARNINGVSFNGSANITITDATRALLAGSTSQAFSTAALTALTADLGITASLRGASGRMNVYGYYDAANGVIVEARNNAMSAYIPLQLQALSIGIYAPNGISATAKLGYNGKAGEALQTAPAAATDLPTSMTAINNVIARLTALGTYT